MKLSYRISSRISIAMLVLFAAWASIFYFIIIDEINDETDDSLEDYSEYIITRALAGESLPSQENGTNNSYHIEEVSAEYASQHRVIQYFDEMVYIQSKQETEPARILKTIFCNSENKYYELIVSIPTIEKADLQVTILWWIIFLYLSLLLSIIIINFWILHRSFKPLYNLLNWFDHFTLKNRIVQLDNETSITEFRQLNDAALRSAQRNVEDYEQQNQFIGNASHELQTPLAACQNRLEMLIEDPDLTEHQASEIAKTLQSLDHIIKLNKTLLLFTKIENNQFSDQKEIILNDLVKKLIEDYSEVYVYRNISVSLQEKSILKVSMNETLAFILFGNLLKNAYIHNLDKGSINILITNTNIAITNTGISQALNPDYIFKRFYQGAKKEGSTGLGLAMAASVCKLYQINIEYAYMDEKHLFTLSFPNPKN